MTQYAESLSITSEIDPNLPTMQGASNLFVEFNMSHEQFVISTRGIYERMTSVIICLCAFSLMMSPQVATPVLSGSIESERPAEEDVENTERELVVASSRRRRREDHRRGNLRYRVVDPIHIDHAVSSAAPADVKAGNRLPNGLSAPLLL